MDAQDRKYIREAQEIKYWSQIEAENKGLASFLTQTGLKTQIGLLNDSHVEITDLFEDELQECKSLYELYNFDLLSQRIKNLLKRYDGKIILKVSHECDPDWDCSGEIVETEHRLLIEEHAFDLRSSRLLYRRNDCHIRQRLWPASQAAKKRYLRDDQRFH